VLVANVLDVKLLVDLGMYVIAAVVVEEVPHLGDVVFAFASLVKAELVDFIACQVLAVLLDELEYGVFESASATLLKSC
jgi:hypothetical protein